MGHAIGYRIYDDAKDIKKLEAQMLSDAREFAFYNVDRGENPAGSYHECFRQKAGYVLEDEDAAMEILDKGFYSDGWVRYKAYEPSKAAKAAESSIPKLREARMAYAENDAKIIAAREKAKEKSDKYTVKVMAKFEVHC